jgi:hypothetical protein
MDMNSIDAAIWVSCGHEKWCWLFTTGEAQRNRHDRFGFFVAFCRPA